jgi:hypothetical protein
MNVPHEHLPVDWPAAAHLRPHHTACSVHYRRTRVGVVCALRAVWDSTWVIHVLRYGPRRARLRPIVAGPNRLRALCVWADREGFSLLMVF